MDDDGDQQSSAGGASAAPTDADLLDHAGPVWVLAAVRDDHGDLVDFRIQVVNSSAADLVHRGVDELTGTLLGEVGAPVVADALLGQCRRVVEAGDEFAGVVEWFDGDDAHVDVRIRRFGDGCVIAGWDVTESWLADQVLEVVDSAVDAIMSVDRDARIVFWSRAATRMYGWTSDEVLGRPPTLVAPEEVQEEQDEHISAALAGDSSVFQTVRRRKDGSSFPVEITIAPVRDRSGQIVRLASVHRDISRRVAAAASLASLQERLRLVLDNSRDVLTVHRGEVIEWCSPAVEGLLGVRPEELVCREIAELVHPDDAEQLAALRSQLDEGRSSAAILRLVATDGRWHWIDVRATPVDGDGDTRVANWRLVDDQIAALAELEAGRTALVESERRYRLVVENSQDAITITEDGVLRWASPAIADITGLQPDALLGCQLTDLVHHDDVAVLAATRARIMAGLGEQAPQRVRIRRSDGTWHWVELRSGPFVGEDGSITGAVSSWRIVDDQVAYIDALSRSEAQNRELAAQLQAALDSRVLIEQAKGMVAAQRAVTPDEAFGLLRDHGRRHGRKLHDVAHDVVQLGLRV